MSNPPSMQGQPGVPAGAVPLSQPLYGASIADAWTRFWKKYATFSGRASRSEYWWWYLIAVVINGVLNSLGRIDGAVGDTFNVVGGLWGLATIVPTLALLWRRLHDTNRSGLWAFAPLVLVGVGVVLLGIAAVMMMGGGSVSTATGIFIVLLAVGFFLVSLVILLILTVLGPNPEGARFDK
ncbi:MAG TPA: DUF805 domain-containing protein [Microlunatus sp.]